MTEPTYVYVKGKGWVPDLGTVVPTFLYTDNNGIVVKAEVRRPKFHEFYYRVGFVRLAEPDWLDKAKEYLPRCAYDKLSQRQNRDDAWYDDYRCIVLTKYD